MKQNPKSEFSKKLLDQTKYIFISQLILASIFAWCGKDTSIFCYTVPSSGGAYAAALGFYLNKAKLENIFKGRIAFLKMKLKMIKKYPPEQQEVIENELNEIDETLDNKIDNTMQEAVQEDINIQN